MAPSKIITVAFDSFSNIVNGEPRNSKNKYNGIDPTTKEKLWDVPVASKDDVDDAVRAANSAYKKWSKKSWEERQEALTCFKEVYASYQNEMTELLMKETGKPKQFAVGEIESIIAWSDWHIKLPEPQLEEYEDEEKTVSTRYVPLGVVAAICPWNFPVLLSVGKILPAVLTGCAIIVKPSPFTPYSSLKVVEIAQQVFPPGLVQVLGGDDKLGPALVDHPDIHKVSFTGSIATGKRIMQAAAKTLKRVTLEVGLPSVAVPFLLTRDSSSVATTRVSSFQTSTLPAPRPKLPSAPFSTAAKSASPPNVSISTKIFTVPSSMPWSHSQSRSRSVRRRKRASCSAPSKMRCNTKR
jgi:acyl-CoA reductase-like NAD-dependent aldehyde dehydrogenase